VSNRFVPLPTYRSTLFFALVALLLVLLGASTGLAAFLSFVEARFDDVDGFDGLAGARGVAVSPDGKHVYVVSEGENALVVLALDETTGSLTFVEAEFDGVDLVDGLAGAQAVAVSSDGAHVYVAGEAGNALAAFGRSASTGEVTFIEAEVDGSGGVDGLGGARSVALSADGAHVYVAGRTDDSVAVFSRDSGSGELTYVESHFDDLLGVDGLSNASGVAVAADGGHVYLVGQGDDAVATFSRDSGTGALSFVEALFDGIDGVEGLGNVRAVVVSADNDHVYTSSQGDNAISVFSRDDVTGELTYVETHVDGTGDVDGLSGSRAVATSMTGSFVVASGTGDDGASLFSRDSGTGGLAFEAAVFDGAEGVDGLNGVRGLALTPDGLHLVAASKTEDAVSVFRLVPCPSEPAVGCREAERAKLIIKIDDDNSSLRDRLRWSWDKGEETLGAALGDPVDGVTNYQLCLYDEPDGAPAFVVSLVVPFGRTCGEDPCWDRTGDALDPRKMKYRNRAVTPDGVSKLKIKAGAAGRAKARVDGEGPELKLDEGALATLPLFPPVAAQLFTSDGECWNAVFNIDDIVANDGPVSGKQRFKASARTP
jgi:6-phosphogluconolactonase (cycloisomerase 2 family)